MRRDDKKKPPTKKISRKQAEQESLLWYFERMDQVNHAMQGTNDLEQAMKDILDTLLAVFECDRAWLVYPCDPEAATWQVPMERTTPEYPSVLPIGVELPLDPVGAEVYRKLRATEGPVKFGPDFEDQVPTVIAQAFHVKSFIAMAFYPKIGKPWSFGLHQCSYARTWTPEEERLFQEIGRRLSDTLTSLLAYRNLQESEEQIKHLIDASPMAMIISSGIEEQVETINAKFIELFGYTIEDMPDVAHWWTLAYPDEKYREEVKTQWHARVEQAIRNKGQIEPMEAAIRCKDGSRHHIEIRLSSIGQKHLVTFVDLTERKRMEEALSTSEAELRTLINAMTDVIFVGNSEGRFLKIVDTSPSLLYKPSKELLGRTLHEVFPKDQADYFLNHLRQALTTQKSVNFEYSLPIGDKRMWFYATASPMTYDKTLMVARDITDRKQAEEALRESEERYRQLVTLSPDGIAIHSQGHILFVNPAMMRMSGATSADQMIGKTVLDLIHPDFRELVRKRMHEMQITGQPISFIEEKLLRVDGSSFDVELAAVPYSFKDTQYIQIVARDITERKRAEAQLLASEQLFRALVEHSPDFIARYDRECRRIYVNPAIQKLFRAPPESMLGKTPADQSPVYTPQVYMDHLKRVIETGIESVTEMPFRTAQGEMHWSHMRFVPEFGPDGQVDSVLHIGRDIHEIKENERRFRMLAENFPDFVIRFDHDGRYLYVNPAFEKMLGMPAASVIGKTLQELPQRIKTEQNDTRLALIRRVFDEGIATEAEIRWDTETGERIFEDRYVPEKDATGNVVTVLCVARDVTEQKRAKEELQRTNGLLRAIIEAAPTAIIGLDLDGNVQHVWNPAAEKMLGWSAEEVMGRFLPSVSVDTEEEFQKFREWVRSGKTMEGVEVQRQRRDGTSIDYSIYASPLHSSEGQIVGNIAVLVDITERKQMSEALAAQEREFRTLAEYSPDNIARYDVDCRTIYVNPTLEKTLGRPASEMLGTIPLEAAFIAEAKEYQEKIAEVLKTGKEQEMDLVMPDIGEGVRYHNIRFVAERGADGAITGIQAIGRDMTDRKQVQEALWKSSQMLKLVLDNMPAYVFWKDRNSVYLGCNNLFAENAGLKSPEEIAGLTDLDLPWKDTEAESYRADDKTVMETGMPKLNYEETQLTADGRLTAVRTSKIPLRNPEGTIIGVLGTFEDITEHKLAEAALQRSEQKFRALAENIPNVVFQCKNDSRYSFLYLNNAIEDLTGYPKDEFLEKGLSFFDLYHPDDLKTMPTPEENNNTDSNRNPFHITYRIRHRAGEWRWVDEWGTGVENAEGKVEFLEGIMIDITERKQAEEAVRESEERYRQLVNFSPDSITVSSQGRVVFANPATVRMAGAHSEGDLIGRSILEFVRPDSREAVLERVEQMQGTGTSTPFVEEKFLRLDGSVMDVEVAIVSYQQQGVDHMQIITRDITQRKRHELEREAIVTVSQALRKAVTRTEMLAVILDQLVQLFDADGSMIALPDPENRDIIIEMGQGVVGERFTGLVIPRGQGISGWVIANKKPYLNNNAHLDSLFYRPDLLGGSQCVAAVPLIAREQAIGALWVVRQTNILEPELRLLNAIADIAANAVHRVMLNEQTEQHLHRLIALHQIDLAISANFDLNVTLKVILKNVKDELKVDASSILLLDPITHTLDYAAGIGFRTRSIESSHVKLGHGYAGRAAQERRTISGPDLNRTHETFSRSSLLVHEEFLAHYATPLVVKGQVKGVLEIFHRKTFESRQDWIDYFETLATQAAIAIESTSLFENLQRSNMELMLAYDATIEGWSRALDLRDRETEGHTQRVTQMVLDLAEKMGMSDAEKIDLRRGALLHDIGKMGVPDAILLKPGTLSKSEQDVMRQHPFYAFQMLSPIPYLKRALEIPYYHHERWDGSGYPHGLKGEEIPLSARMFAVVDVFDALTSDRPYRAAWPREKAYRYIQEQAGRHLDPQIVKIFLEGI